MSKFTKQIHSFLCFGGLNRETYYEIRDRISEENKRSTNIFTLLGALAFLITGLSTSFAKTGASVTVYYTGAGIMVLMFLLNFLLSKKIPKISDFFAVVFSVLILGFGIGIAYSQPNERTTMLLPLFGLVSLVFCYRPIYLIIILPVSEIVYLLLMKGLQTPELYLVNLVNTLIFTIVGLLGGLYTLAFKHKKHEADHKNQTLLEKDVLTGLYNRYSWSKAFEKIEKDKLNVTICSIDVNGLKKINDSKGHLAGDELINGAAICIKDVFENYGEIYRIGGDEFSVIIYKDYDEAKLRKNLDARTKYWEGKKCSDLTVSLGMAKLDYSKGNTIEETIHLADLEMYKAKQEYYEKNK